MANRKKDIELLARAIVVRGGLLLLAHRKGARNTFLPGGHIEWGEPARAALERELLEETGLRLCAGEFLGAVEHSFGSRKKRTHEVNLLFRVGGRKFPTLVVSIEPKLEFLWQPLGKLREANLQPRPLQRLIPLMTKRKLAVWAGTIE